MRNYPCLHVFRASVLRLSPYSSARDEFKGQAEVFLDANENPFARRDGFNRYPDPHQTQLKNRISAIKGISPEHIFLGNGSDEPIDLLIRATCMPGKDKVVITSPTYGMYSVSAAINDVECIDIPLLRPDFQPDVERILAESGGAKLLFICSPNNPTANLVEPSRLERLIAGFKGLVVLDEAYIDFAAGASMLPRLNEFPNLVILQTLSKAWGLAGVRIGMAFAHPDVIAILGRIKPPYNISGPAQQITLEALAELSGYQEELQEILSQRAFLESALHQISGVLEIFPSDANFILVRMERAGELFLALQGQGIIVRDRSKQIPDALRFTVGTPAENQQLITSIQSFYKPSTC